MKRILFCLMLTGWVLCSSLSYAEQNTDVKLNEIKQLESVIQQLGDEQHTQDMLKELNVLLEAKKELLAKQQGKASKAKAGVDFVAVFSRYQALFSSKMQGFGEKLGAVASDYNKLTDYFTARENVSRLLDLGLKLVLAGVVGLLLLIALKKSAGHWSAKLAVEDVAGFSQKFKAACLGWFLDVYPLLILTAAAWVFLWLVLPETAPLLTRILAAAVIYRVISHFIFQLIAPGDAGRRLPNIVNETANYIVIWARRLMRFSLCAYLAVALSCFYGLQELAFAVYTFYKVGILVLLSMILAQWKEPISAKLSFELLDADYSPTLALKRFFNSVAGQLYLLFLGYFAAVVLLSSLGFGKLWRYLLYSMLKSLMVVVAVVVFWRLWDMFYRWLFEVSAGIRRQLPELEKQVNRYVNWISKLGHLCILAIGFLTVLGMWRVNVFELLLRYADYIFRLIRIPVILGIAVVFVQVGNFMIKKFELKIANRRKDKEDIPDIEIEKQVATIGGVLRKTVIITTWVIAALMVIRELGFDIGPALAGAGIFGVALGFGTQHLVRDVISGLFMIAENQIRVGDVAILNGTGGLVEAIHLRTTVLRGLDGTVHVFPNGSVSTLSNMTREFSFYLFDIGVAYKEDTDRVCGVLMQLSDEIMQDKEFAPSILEPLEILGLDKFGDSAVIIKARIKTLPIKQWMIGREMNRRIKKRFDEEGIEIPFPHRTFYFGEVSPPVKVKTE